MGQIERFTPSRLSDRNGFVKETLAGTGATDGNAPILLKKSLSRIREEYSVLGQLICARMIRIGYVARTIISQNRLYFAEIPTFSTICRVARRILTAGRSQIRT